MNEKKTFTELSELITGFPDYQVEISDRFIGSTHLFVNNQNAVIGGIKKTLKNGTNLLSVPEAIQSKKLLIEVANEIDAGRISPAKNDNFNLR